jgi:NADH dehydrogenase FAD-containing subunit
MNSFSQPHPAPVPARPKIVIAGGRYAGLAAARRLRPAPVGVTLPGQGTANVFQPPLYQSATEAAIRRADHPATSQTPSPLYGLRYEVLGGR